MLNNISNKMMQAIVLANNDMPEDKGSITPPGMDQVSVILGWAKWGALAICIACLIGFGATLAMSRQSGGGAGETGWLGKILLSVLVISGAFSIIQFLLGN